MNSCLNSDTNTKMRPTMNPVVLFVCVFAGILVFCIISQTSVRLFSPTPTTFKIFNVSYSSDDKNNTKTRIENTAMNIDNIIRSERDSIISELANGDSTGKSIEVSALTSATNVHPIQGGEWNHFY